MDNGTLIVSEVFCPAVQGEGPNLGVRCGFIRLYGCNLSCGGCDSTYAWNDGEHLTIPVDIIVERITGSVDIPVELIVITGGEPLLQQHRPGMNALITILERQGIRVQFETNGTRIPASWLQKRLDTGQVTFVVSPKIGGPLATDQPYRRINQDAISYFAGSLHATFKFVVGSVEDVVDVANFTQRWMIAPSKVWIMPAGISSETIMETSRAVVDHALSYGFNMTTRLQVLIWPNERGR